MVLAMQYLWIGSQGNLPFDAHMVSMDISDVSQMESLPGFDLSGEKGSSSPSDQMKRPVSMIGMATAKIGAQCKAALEKIKFHIAPLIRASVMATSLCILAGTVSAQDTSTSAATWTVPEIGALPYDDYGNLVRRGRDLITATYAHIGPSAPADKRYAGNNLACTNCHLQAGTRKFGLPIFGLFELFPQYSARAGAEITIEDRINSCMTRSMNGRPLPLAAPEMAAIVAYIKFLSTGVPAGEKLPGLGTGQMPELGRAADPVRGKSIYAEACVQCHYSNGEGIVRNDLVTSTGYWVPPLWGLDTFNDGAGMNRLITMANFVHYNMPHGADYLNPQLSVEDAWDVAAYVVSQPRPQKAGLEKDYPDLLAKPVDAPYGPYADSFSRQQHIYGPFAPIREMLARLKAGKAPSSSNR